MILVTGGAGFIGTNLVNFLLRKNEKIILLDNLSIPTGKKNLQSTHNHKNLKFFRGNIGDKKIVEKILKKYRPKTIINVAAETHVDQSIKYPQKFISSNILGVYNLLECARRYVSENNKIKKSSFRFIHISTDEVFGSLKKNEKPFGEKNRYIPSNPYSASKAAADHLVNAWHVTYNLPTIVTNCSNNYGPYQYFEKLIPLTIIRALSENKIPIYGKGNQIRDWLYVEDHCSAIYTVLKKGKVGSSYNIGGGCEKKNLSTVKAICKYLDKVRPRKSGKKYSELILFIEDRPGHDFRYAISSRKMFREFKWKPKVNFSAGLEKTINWYLENIDWVNISKNSVFKNWEKTQY